VDVQSPYLDVQQAADYCRVAKQTIYNRRREIERLPGVRKLLFTREALDRWLRVRQKRAQKIAR
jgi:hypothetical protein